MLTPADLRYLPSHEWCRLDGDVATLGITDFAQDQLGDVVYIELPNVGDTIANDDAFGSIESVKAASDLVCPLTGEVLETNPALADNPELVNTDPYGAGWLIKLKASDLAEAEALLDAATYATHCENEGH